MSPPLARRGWARAGNVLLVALVAALQAAGPQAGSPGMCRTWWQGWPGPLRLRLRAHLGRPGTGEELLAVLALLAGVPLGVAAGRWAWALFATGLGISGPAL